MNRRGLLVLSLLSSAAYWLGSFWPPFAGSVMLKGLAVSSLALLAWAEIPLLGIALAFSSLGDILLEFPGLFVWGLASFLVTHLLYIVLFRRYWREPAGLRAWIGMAGVGAYSVAFLSILGPLGNLRIPVDFYIGAITVMVMASIRATWSTRMVVTGALLFLLSDSVLGFDRFVWHVPFRNFVVWPTYYVGQLAIALGVLRSQAARS